VWGRANSYPVLVGADQQFRLHSIVITSTTTMEPIQCADPLCQAKLQTAIQFIHDTGNCFSVKTSGKYHTTHKSSEKNTHIGILVNCIKWDISTDAISFLPNNKVHHPHIPAHPFSPAIRTEADGVAYAHSTIFLPLLSVLNKHFPNLELDLRYENNETAIVQLADGTVLEAESRIDVSIFARSRGSAEEAVVLLFEAKAPGTLHAEEWKVGLLTERGKMRGNALPISQQVRKYMQANEHPRCFIADTQCLIGIQLDQEEDELWTTGDELRAGLQVRLFALRHGSHRNTRLFGLIYAIPLGVTGSAFHPQGPQWYPLRFLESIAHPMWHAIISVLLYIRVPYLHTSIRSRFAQGAIHHKDFGYRINVLPTRHSFSNVDQQSRIIVDESQSD
jgi:hypothetical protein